MLKFLIFLAAIRWLCTCLEDHSLENKWEQQHSLFFFCFLLSFIYFFTLLLYYPTNIVYVSILGPDFINTVLNESISIELTAIIKFNFWWLEVEHLYFKIS